MLALYLLTPHTVHAAAEAAAALNYPAAHAAIVKPEPVKPASAVQSSSASDADELPELSGHAVQVSDV